jgi:hypothetical protein
MIAAAVFQKKPWGLKYIWFKKSGIRTLLHNDRIFSTAEVYPPCSERASYYHNGIRIAYAFQEDFPFTLVPTSNAPAKVQSTGD